MNQIQSPPALVLDGLVKRYRDFTLGPLYFELKPGTVVGLVGPNGSGKTTTINTIVGLIKEDSGHVEIFGIETHPNNINWKFDIGYVGDEHVFYEYWSGERNLKFIAQFYPSWSWDKAHELADRFQLDLKKRANRLSKGNRAKLALIGALAHQPRLLLLDEPSSGLDPIVRSEFLDVLWEVNETGNAAILYSTHILSDIGRIADELAFLKDGKLALRKTRDELLDKWRQISFTCDLDVKELQSVVSIKKQGNFYLTISCDFEVTSEILKGIKHTNLLVTPLTLDEIAVHIMKGKTSEVEKL